MSVRDMRDLEGALAALAAGEALDQVVRATLSALGEGPQRGAVLLVGGRRPSRTTTHGQLHDCAITAARRSLQEGIDVCQTDPPAEIEARAVPVRSHGEVVGAVAVAGPGDPSDRDLRTAAHILAVALAAHGPEAPAAVVLDSIAGLAEAGTDRERLRAAVDALSRVTGLPAFVGLERAGRLEIVRYEGLERQELQTLVANAEFRSHVAEWRDRPLPTTQPAIIRSDEGSAGSAMLVCAPLHDGVLRGLLAAVVPGGSEDAVSETVRHLARHATAQLAARRSEEEADRRDREVDAVVQTLPSPALVVDGAGRIVRINAAACELFGLSGSFDAGRPLRGRLGHDELEAMVLDSDRPIDREVTAGAPPQRFRAVTGSAFDGNAPDRRVLVLEPVLSEGDDADAKERFVAVVGHELRTPLTVIRGFTETIRSRGDGLDAADRERFLGKVLHATDRLHFLIEDLLLLSVPRDRIRIAAGPTDPRRVADEVVAVSLAVAPDRTIECIELGGVREHPLDGRRVAHVLHHLVDNAIKYTEGPVRIELRGDPEGIDFAVVDQGPGIYSGDVERLLQPFEQADGSSTRVQGGIGVGLHVARILVEAMGGRLGVDSRLGHGCRFSFRVGTRGAVQSPAREVARDDSGR